MRRVFAAWFVAASSRAPRPVAAAGHEVCSDVPGWSSSASSFGFGRDYICTDFDIPTCRLHGASYPSRVDGRTAFAACCICGGGVRSGCRDILALAHGSSELSVFVAAVVASGLDSTLKGPGPFTVFAPTDQAFANTPDLHELLKPASRERLANLLALHVVSGTLLSTDLRDGQVATSMQGQGITAKLAGGIVSINDANVLQADLKACNGIIHTVNKVLQPSARRVTASVPAASTCEDMPGWCDSASRAGFERDFCCADYSRGWCQAQGNSYPSHPGGVTAAQACCVCGGGAGARAAPAVRGLLPSVATSTPPAGSWKADPAAHWLPVSSGGSPDAVSNMYCQDIITIVGTTSRLSMVAAGAVATGLVEELQGAGQYTVFAPTNEAFDQIDQATMASLLALEDTEHPELDDMLSYHVVPGRVRVRDMRDGQVLTALQGGRLTVRLVSGGVRVNDANVLRADIIACNGVIHVIDLVLEPSAATNYNDSSMDGAEDAREEGSWGGGDITASLPAWGVVCITIGALLFLAICIGVCLYCRNRERKAATKQPKGQQEAEHKQQQQRDPRGKYGQKHEGGQCAEEADAAVGRDPDARRAAHDASTGFGAQRGANPLAGSFPAAGAAGGPGAWAPPDSQRPPGAPPSRARSAALPPRPPPSRHSTVKCAAPPPAPPSRPPSQAGLPPGRRPPASRSGADIDGLFGSQHGRLG